MSQDTSANTSEAPRTSVNASDPYERTQQTFPILSNDQVERLTAYGEVADFDTGAILFERGDRGADFFLILDGSIEIFELIENGDPNIITTHRKHQFTGELDLFNQRKILVGGRTGEPSRLVRLNRQQFNRMSSTETDIGETIMRAFILRRSAFLMHNEAGVTLIGKPNDRDLIRIRRFLTRNGYPLTVMDCQDDETEAFAKNHGFDLAELPILRTPDGELYFNPSTPDVADLLGMTEEFDPDHVFDLAVIGAGPSGLSACVYGASENLDTIVIESEAPGGQAGTSSRIENYLGFPTGISGQALAGRAWIQGQKFGARFAIARAATGIRKDQDTFVLDIEDTQQVRARSVILACGATYRRLSLDNYEKYEGQGIHYAATALEAQFCIDTEVAVIGGGNSAGQAAVFLSGFANHVHVLVRGEGLAASMSDYLIQRIEQSSRITLHPFSELTELRGDRMLKQVVWKNSQTGKSEEHDVSNVFVMIGAIPNTGWMGDCVKLDDRGFVLTGDHANQDLGSSPFQTSVKGLFAVGDMRSGSVKRVASGVGEGSVCVSGVHTFLGERT